MGNVGGISMHKPEIYVSGIQNHRAYFTYAACAPLMFRFGTHGISARSRCPVFSIGCFSPSASKRL